MARASTVAWMGVVVGMALGASAAAGVAPFALVGVSSALGQTPARPANVRAAFNSAIDSYRRADYESADQLFRQIQAAQEELSADERQELENLVHLNGTALKARQDGTDQLHQAEKAILAGRTAEASKLLKIVTANQFLTVEEKARAVHLAERLRTSPPGTSASAAPAPAVPSPAASRKPAEKASPAASSSSVSPTVLARSKLYQARQLLSKANYDAAEALAREAEQLKVPFRPGEDTPARVLDDVARVRSDPKKLLTSARVAYQCGDLDRAEHMAKAAEKASSSGGWSMSAWWTDSPAKVLKDVQAARSRPAKSGDAPKEAPKPVPVVKNKPEDKPVAKNKPADSPPPSNDESAHQLLKDGRTALKQGDLVKAQECADRALAANGSFHWWEDSPAKLSLDVQRGVGKDRRFTVLNQKPAPAADKSQGSVVAEGEDPHITLKNARELYTGGKLDEAEALAQQVQAGGFKNWGLFEDTPEKLLLDVRTAHVKQDREESVRLLAEARKLLEQGDYKTAQTCAYKAEKLHGPYSLWDLGDRPSKVIADLTVAQSRSRKAAGNEAAATALARKEPAKKDTAQPNGPPSPNPEFVAPVHGKVEIVNNPPSAMERPGDIQPAGTMMPAAPKEIAPPGPALQGTDNESGNQKARRLLAEVRQLQQQNQLVEARQKALEAQKQGAAFEGEEDRPDRALLQLAEMAYKNIEGLQQKATDLAATAYVDANRYQEAEKLLTQARQLAVGFALDTQAIDTKMSWVQRTREQAQTAAAAPNPAPAEAPAGAPPVTPVQHAEGPKAPPNTPQQAGAEMLEKARLELKSGQVETARRLAVEVYNGPFGLQAQADAVLHSIDAEEFNQKILTANRSFDAGLAAYVAKDFAQASNILRALDAPMLSQDRQAKLKDLMKMPEIQPGGVTQAVGRAPLPMGDAAQPGRATATDAPGPPPPATPERTYAQQVNALQEVQFQKLRDDGLDAQRKAVECFRNGEAAQALEILQNYLTGLGETPVEAERLAMLQRPVEARLQQFKKLKAQQDFEKEQTGQRNTFGQLMQRDAQLEEHKKEQVTELLKKYHAFYDKGKYAEAEMVALQAHDLDPDNTAAGAAVHVAHMHRNYTEYQKIKDGKEAMVIGGLNDSETEGPFVNTREPVKFDPDSMERIKNRKAFPKDGWGIQKFSEKEREIERRLSMPISLDFKNESLKHVIEDLRDLTGINIVPDMPALEAENISLDRPIDMHLEGITTKVALNLVLHYAHLIYVIRDEVLVVTTEAYARGKLVAKTYQVADLILPVENYNLPVSASLTKTMEQVSARHSLALQGNAAVPYLNKNSLPNGAAVGGSSGASTPSAAGTPEAGRAPGQTLEDLLLKMITSTIKPESWSDMGGPGTIEYYPLGMALVINQTPDIQEQVAELLTALRRLQDIEVTVEVRFITVSEAFYERIGLDFNVNVQAESTKNEQLIVAQQFRPLGFNNTFSPSSFVTGLLPGGSQFPPGAYTSDLSIPIRNSSFTPAIPPFGGFPNALGQNGGLSLGLAFLSDIQVFLFMEAAQADRRTNVMQAPKLTLFNGQNSTININTQQFFVTSVDVIQINGQVVFVPTNSPFPLGVQLSIQAVVSADRRFVRLNLNPNLTNLASPVTALFPVTTFITPVFDNGAQGQPVPFTQYVQQPNFTQISVNTTVNVPDGGTVLLGGLKTMREGRNEFGPPILSKLPYVNRLFKNVGYGREAESLMIMVTPRVIIQEEEETRQTGVGTGLGVPGGGPTP